VRATPAERLLPISHPPASALFASASYIMKAGRPSATGPPRRPGGTAHPPIAGGAGTRPPGRRRWGGLPGPLGRSLRSAALRGARSSARSSATPLVMTASRDCAAAALRSLPRVPGRRSSRVLPPVGEMRSVALRMRPGRRRTVCPRSLGCGLARCGCRRRRREQGRRARALPHGQTARPALRDLRGSEHLGRGQVLRPADRSAAVTRFAGFCTQGGGPVPA
jgi:hypothetical protein